MGGGRGRRERETTDGPLRMTCKEWAGRDFFVMTCRAGKQLPWVGLKDPTAIATGIGCLRRLLCMYLSVWLTREVSTEDRIADL